MKLSSFLLFFFLLPLGLSAQAPRIFFSDLESGPNIGGQANKGAWVAIWGKGFGAERGASTVTVGGGATVAYPLWTDTQIIFQLGPASRTGNIVVNLRGKEGTRKDASHASNGVPFTVRAGKIYFVAVNGSDRRRGTFEAPWKSIVRAKNSMSAGDITYIENGVTQSGEDTFGASLSMDRNGASNSGKPGAPKALVAYPGAKVTIGKEHELEYAMRTPNIPAREDYWVISQLHLIGGRQAMDIGGTGWRVVGNEMECPGADGQVGCVEASGANQMRFYGNEVHNAGVKPASSKFYHAVYFSTDSNHIDVGWNHIHDNYTCRALQFHSSPLCSPSCGAADTTGFNQFDLHVHDNLIHGDNCNGINFATVDPSKGTVEAYNNVIFHVGLMDAKGDGGAFSCIYVAGITNHGPEGTGAVEVFNNTLYDCGANNSRNAGGARGAFSVGGGPRSLTMRLRNNVVQQLSGEIYIDGNKSQITGEKNLWYGMGDGPSQTQGNINADPQFVNLQFANPKFVNPQFVNTGGFDFHLRSSSPARDAGAAAIPGNPFVPGSAQPTDKDGVARPQGKAFDLGAYEVPR
jgi:hypothetical protein